MGNERVNVLYKFYNKDEELLYIGITNSPDKRFYIHSMDKEWFNEVDKVMCSDKMTRNEVSIYEIYTIMAEHPKYNVEYTDGGSIRFSLPELSFTEYTDFKVYKPKSFVEKFIRWYLNGESFEEIAEKTGNTVEYVELLISKEYDLEKEELKSYLDTIIGKRLFLEDRNELTSFITNLKLCSNGIDYRTKVIKSSTLQNIINSLDLNYIISPTKRERSSKSDKEGKSYIVISNK